MSICPIVVSRYGLFLEKARLSTYLFVLKVCSNNPVAVFQSLTVLFLDADTTSFPSGEKVTALIFLV